MPPQPPRDSACVARGCAQLATSWAYRHEGGGAMWSPVCARHAEARDSGPVRFETEHVRSKRTPGVPEQRTEAPGESASRITATLLAAADEDEAARKIIDLRGESPDTLVQVIADLYGRLIGAREALGES